MTKILFRRHWIKSRSKIKHLHLHLVCRAIKRFVLDVDAVVVVGDAVVVVGDAVVVVGDVIVASIKF